MNNIINKLLNYNNENNLSWIRVFKEVINSLNIKYTDKLLHEVVIELTKLGYDIIDEPFTLKKYK